MNQAGIERSQVRFGTKTIDYRIHRSAKRTTVSIAIDAIEGVLVTAPRQASIERLDTIIHARGAWVIERLKRRSELPAPPPKEFVSGETFLYLGRQYRIAVAVDKSPRLPRLDAGWLRVSIPRLLPEEHRTRYIRAALKDWYKTRGTKRILERATMWSAKLQLGEPKLILAEPRKRWGSASSAGVVRINWRVIQAPLALVDYVVVHELVHLRHPNHTRDFWRTIGLVMPDFEHRKARLRYLGPQLEW